MIKKQIKGDSILNENNTSHFYSMVILYRYCCIDILFFLNFIQGE